MPILTTLKGIRNNSSKKQKLQYDGHTFHFEKKEVKVLEPGAAAHALKMNLWQVKGDQTNYGSLFSEVKITAAMMEKQTPEVVPAKSFPKEEQESHDAIVQSVIANLLAKGWKAPESELFDEEGKEDVED